MNRIYRVRHSSMIVVMLTLFWCGVIVVSPLEAGHKMLIVICIVVGSISIHAVLKTDAGVYWWKPRGDSL